MRDQPRLRRIILMLRPEEYRPFPAAVRRLRRIMGPEAPDAELLILANLKGRDARGLADDYLDAVDWPMERRRPPGKRLAVRFGGRVLAAKHVRAIMRRAPMPRDPGRN